MNIRSDHRRQATLRTSRRKAGLVLLVGSLALAGACVNPDPGPGPTTTTTTIGQPPPDIVVEGGARTLRLRPYTYCYAHFCSDGFVPANPPSVGSPAEVTLRFPAENWEFAAQFWPVGRPVEASIDVPVVSAGTAHRITPAQVPPGDYRVMIYGYGPVDGDVAAAFAWTVTGPSPSGQHQ